MATPPLRRRGQFSLAELFLLFLPVAAGARFPMLLPLLIPGTALYFVWRLCSERPPYFRYRILLPSVWGVSTWMSFHHPGDEYGLFGIGALPASWLMTLTSISELKRMLPYILLCGMASMFLAGWTLDRMRVRLVIWLAAVLLMCAVLVGLMLSSYPSMARAIAKNGSLTSYITSALNVSLYSITCLSFVVTPIWRGAVNVIAKLGERRQR